MKLERLYTALLVTDLSQAEVWYMKLLGRKPDYRPMDTMVQWDLTVTAGLQLVSDPELARHGAMSLVVEDVEAERARLGKLGLPLGDSRQGTYSTLATIHDPDDNVIVLATPPSPPYPPA